MSDRTACTLFLKKVANLPDAEALKEVAFALHYADVEEFKSENEILTELKRKLTKEGISFEFLDIDGGNIDTGVRDALKDAGISFIWSWSAGLEYEPGIYFFDAEEDDEMEYTAQFGRIVLSVEELTPPNISAAKRWDAWQSAA